MSVSVRNPNSQPVTQRQWVRRGELLDAARRVFERDGYHAATVSAIVQAAGLSQGAFYLYFPDKKAVFAALLGGDGDVAAAAHLLGHPRRTRSLPCD